MKYEDLQPVSICEYSLRNACELVSRSLNKVADEELEYGINKVVHSTCEFFTEQLIKIVFEKGENEDGREEK